MKLSIRYMYIVHVHVHVYTVQHSFTNAIHYSTWNYQLRFKVGAFRTMFKLVEELLVVIKFKFGDLVHETFNVSHTKQLADKWTSLELFQIVNVLPRTDEGDWTLSGSNSEREREGGGSDTHDIT